MPPDTLGIVVAFISICRSAIDLLIVVTIKMQG